jgi:predicted ATPase
MIWQIALLGNVSAHSGEWEITRFGSNRVVALLARLALFPERIHTREELIELLWPEVDPEIGRNRLRNTLSMLRAQLEPLGVPVGSVLTTTRLSIRLPTECVETDVAAWERLARAGKYTEAEALWKGELLPGFYDDWILIERERLNAIREGIPQNITVPEPVSQAIYEPVYEAARVALPHYATRFFGRTGEREQVGDLLQHAQCVTLTGSGGMGKTRLSVEVARAVATRFPGGVAFVPLAHHWSADNILEAIRVTLDLPTNRNPLDAIRQKAAQTPTLVLLDNFEQLVAVGGAEVVEMLLSQVPALTLLITSRRALRIAGEHEVPLAPLPLPKIQTATTLLEASRVPSIALFIDRAQAVRPTFALREDNLEAVLALCRRLEGLPLSLELASSRVRAYTLAQMEAALADRFTLLTRQGSASRKEMRHASLRATIEWSWQLLSPVSRRLFAQMSVFRGGATADAIQAVCEEPDAQVLLEGLVADSLVVASGNEDDSAEMRFSLLETLREFAAERLPEISREMPTAFRHADYYLALVARADDEDDMRVLDALESDLGNFETALEFGWENARNDAFWKGLSGYLTFAFVRGHHRHTTVWIDRIFASWQAISDPDVRFMALERAIRCSIAHTHQTDVTRYKKIQTYAEKARNEAQALGDPQWIARTLTTWGFTISMWGEETIPSLYDFGEIVELMRSALEMARLLDDPKTLVYILHSTARVMATAKLWEESERLANEALERIGSHSMLHANLHLILYVAISHNNGSSPPPSQTREQEAYPCLKNAQFWALRLRNMTVLMYGFWYENKLEIKYGSMMQAALLYGAFRHLREQMDFAAQVNEVEDQKPMRDALGEEAYTHQLALSRQIPLETLVVPRTWSELTASHTPSQQTLN